MDNTGFDAVTQLPDARRQLRDCYSPHGRSEQCPTGDAAGRILAEAVTARRAVPHYDRAAMDGYAVRAEDTFNASDRSPVRLRVDESVTAGTAVQVHTGSAIPDGADAVVMVEYAEQREDGVLVYDAVAGGENVAPAGEDVEASQHLFDAGHRCKPSDLALLRATGRDAVEVAEKPRVSVIPTGDELVAAGEEPGPGELVETNGLVVSQLVEQWGGKPTYRGIATDERGALRRAIETDTDHDIVVTTGGSSVGERDLIPDVVTELGDVVVHGVSIKPGHPVGFGVVDGTPVLMLPGYPVSCLVNAVQFLRPAIAWQAGTEPSSHPTTEARLAEKIRSSPGERTFARVAVDEQPEDESLPACEPVRVSGAGVMSSVTLADGWVEIPESREGIPAGETVTLQQWE
ncbi:MAG: gephyrin-like molybdotransferase Glp [Halovenus sp.]